MRKALLLLAPALALGVLASAQGVTTANPGRDRATGILPVPPPPPWTQGANLPSAPPPVVVQGEARSFCTSTTNSTGLAAKMGCAGSLSVCQNNTCLVAEGVPAGSFGLFIYGSHEARLPVANGTLCVSPFHPGLFRIAPAVVANASLRAELELDIPSLPAAGAITPGSTWCFQYWFRDAAAGGAGSDFSDGLRITFCH